MGIRAVTPRDATDSWAGYLYQSVLGLVVTLERVLQLHDSNQAINGHFVYEDIEDFSVYIKDSGGNVTSASTYQSKYKKGETPSIYYPFISALSRSGIANPNLQFFLNISTNVDFPDNPETTVNLLPANYTSYLYQYRNGNRYMGGGECLNYLEDLILEYCQKNSLTRAPEQIEKTCALLIAFIDTIIIETKNEREQNPTYRREITFQEILTQIANVGTELTSDLVTKTLKKRFLRALFLFTEPLPEDAPNKLDAVAKWVTACNEEEFLSLVKKMHIHKDLTVDTDLASSFISPEDLQEILFTVANSVAIPFECQGVIFKKKHNAYRPSTLRTARNRLTTHQNLKFEYLPKIKRNMSEHDIEGYFETKKIIIDGQTIEDIWVYEITSSDTEKAENKINEPELKTLISVEDAIGELNGND